MARPATGWVQWRAGKEGEHWYAQVTLKDGTRSDWVSLDPKIPNGAPGSPGYLAAKAAAKVASDDARLHGMVRHATTRKTVNEYAKTWVEYRTGRVRSVGDNERHLRNHVLPVLGVLEVARVTRADVERFVASLDAKVSKGELSAKTARNIWGTCSKLFDDATNAKEATGLRCLEADPTIGVRGPDDDEAGKLLQFLYPSEFATFIACEDVSRRWRRNAALAVYLCLRVGEQAALKWSAVDLEHGVVTIQETFDRVTRACREGTKGGAARVIPIRPELLPLLQAMHAEAKTAAKGAEPEGSVCKLSHLQDMAAVLRRWLKRAGVDREGLHKGTSVSKPLRWHDLRATGATWMAVEGKSPAEIRDILGHTQTSMTDRYMRSANVLRGGRFGTPFPPVPATLGFRQGSASEAKFPSIPRKNQCEGGEGHPSG
jgi:integrase